MADPPRPPRARSATLDEAIARRRAQEEAEAEAEAEAEKEARGTHQAWEPTNPPPPAQRAPRPAAMPREVWPPRVVEAQGSPSVMAPPKKHADAAHKAMVSVWGIIVILFGAAAGGWGARAFYGDVATLKALNELAAEVKEVKRICTANQGFNQETFAGIKTDLEWLKREQSKQPEPIKPPGRR